MYICKVVGKVVATIRNPLLGPSSLVLVRRLDANGQMGAEVFVAADPIGCGDGDTVLVCRGSAACYAVSGVNAPVDLAVVGIVDAGSEAEPAPPAPNSDKKQKSTQQK